MLNRFLEATMYLVLLHFVRGCNRAMEWWRGKVTRPQCFVNLCLDILHTCTCVSVALEQGDLITYDPEGTVCSSKLKSSLYEQCVLRWRNPFSMVIWTCSTSVSIPGEKKTSAALLVGLRSHFYSNRSGAI